LGLFGFRFARKRTSDQTIADVSFVLLLAVEPSEPISNTALNALRLSQKQSSVIDVQHVVPHRPHLQGVGAFLIALHLTAPIPPPMVT
jgi:hypothetical protein